MPSEIWGLFHAEMGTDLKEKLKLGGGGGAPHIKQLEFVPSSKLEQFMRGGGGGGVIKLCW